MLLKTFFFKDTFAIMDLPNRVCGVVAGQLLITQVISMPDLFPALSHILPLSFQKFTEFLCHLIEFLCSLGPDGELYSHVCILSVRRGWQ